VEITEVRIKLMDDPHERLQGFCSITFDGCFVIRDLKIIQGTKGPFVAMPSRKLTDRCPKCNTKNHLRAMCCNQCGTHLKEDRAIKDDDGRAKLYADIAHPINSQCRDMIQRSVLKSYDEELVRARSDNYICRYDDYGEENYAALADGYEEPAQVTIHRDGDKSHRIEPAAASQPNPPHHESPDESPKEATTTNQRETFADDGFGAGVV